MKDDKKEKSEQRYTERIRLIKDRVVNTRPEMDLENARSGKCENYDRKL